jgi:hypothetical protein
VLSWSEGKDPADHPSAPQVPPLLLGVLEDPQMPRETVKKILHFSYSEKPKFPSRTRFMFPCSSFYLLEDSVIR